MNRKARVGFQSNTNNVVKSIEDVAARRMWQALNHVRSVTVETLSGTRHGKVAQVPGTSRTYIQSAPGEPPAVMLGDLRRSIKIQMEAKRDRLIGYVGSELEKAPKLEFGSGALKPRPYLRPSFQKAKQRIEEIMGRRWFDGYGKGDSYGDIHTPDE